jgi:hypothetical protein
MQKDVFLMYQNTKINTTQTIHSPKPDGPMSRAPWDVYRITYLSPLVLQAPTHSFFFVAALYIITIRAEFVWLVS